MSANHRRSLLARVHMAKKELGLCDEAYRGILAERFGVESAGELQVAGLVDLVELFKGMGWVQKRKFTPKKERKPLVKKVWALCYALGRPVPEYGDGIAKRMYGVEKLVWLDDRQLIGVVTALEKYRRGGGS